MKHVEIKDIVLPKDEPYYIKWNELTANTIDDGRFFCATSFDGQWCCTGTIVDYEENLKNKNPTLNVLYVYKLKQTRMSFHEPDESPILTVDAVIVYNGKIVLVKRKYPPFQGYFALPGGHVDIGETVEHAVIREAKEETGLDIEIVRLQGVYSDPTRDPRGHTVSVCYLAEGKGTLKAGSDAKEIALVGLDDMSELTLAFDHSKILYNSLRDSKGELWIRLQRS